MRSALRYCKANMNIEGCQEAVAREQETMAAIAAFRDLNKAQAILSHSP